MGKALRRALAISLLLHFLLLWPSAAQRPADDPLPALMATLRQPPAVPASPVRAVSRPAPDAAPAPTSAAPVPAVAAKHAAAPRVAFAEAVLPAPAVTSAAPSAADALPRSNSPAVAAATAASPSDGSAEGMRQYRLALAVEARRYKRYPPRALDAGIGGTAEVRIEVADGRAAEVTLGRPSGDAALDAAALEMLRKAAPRTAVPEALQRRSFAVSLPIVFDPNE